jgi:hypothetical protein
MDLDRCPKCAAAVRKDADWCTLCYADLRPAPAPPPVIPAAPVAAPAPITAPSPTNHLDAPYERVLAAVYAGDSVPQIPVEAATAPEPASEPGKASGWPCTGCGELNSFDTANCGVCMSPFGAQLRGVVPTVDRQRMRTMAIGAAAIFLLLVAALTYVTTKRPPEDAGTNVTVTDVTPADEPRDQAPVEQAPAQQMPGQPLQPGQAVPAQPLQPGQAVPGQAAVPGQPSIPGQPLDPAQPVPGQIPPQVVTP